MRALTFEFNGIARSELKAARMIGEATRVLEHRFVRLPDLKEAGDIEGFDLRGLPRSYIPMRNAIFYSFAGSMAEETGAGAIVGGHNQDDGRVFDDVSEAFFAAIENSMRMGSPLLRRNRLKIERPLRLKTKAQVVSLARDLAVPLEMTWSCHRDGREHCWDCDGCASRAAAFTGAGVPDPLKSSPRQKIT